MTAAAPVLDEHRFATPRIAADCRCGVLAHSRALMFIVPGNADQRDDENRGSKDRNEELIGD
jgi:hypothetical protein